LSDGWGLLSSRACSARERNDHGDSPYPPLYEGGENGARQTIAHKAGEKGSR